jgi:hypothetical protein
MSDHINGAQKSEDQNNRNSKVETQKYDSNVYEIVQCFCLNNI